MAPDPFGAKHKAGQAGQAWRVGHVGICDWFVSRKNRVYPLAADSVAVRTHQAYPAHQAHPAYRTGSGAISPWISPARLSAASMLAQMFSSPTCSWNSD